MQPGLLDRRAIIDIPPIPDFGAVSFKSDTLNSAFKRTFEGFIDEKGNVAVYKKSKGADMDSLASGF